MKALYLIVPLSAAALVGCTVYRPVAYTTPAPVAYVQPAYVNPPNTVVLGAGPSDWALMDSDGDGVPNGQDRYPYDARYH